MAKYKDQFGNVIEVGSPELNPNLIQGKTRVPDTTPLSSTMRDYFTTPSGFKITSDMLGNTNPLNPAIPDYTPPSDISGLQPAEIKMTSQEEKQTSFEKDWRIFNYP